jgi:hypothetical protein
MFHPIDHPLERGWVGRIEGERVVHLAAQTLQSFFTGGGSAREHAEYALADVCLLAPVLHPPAVRIFDAQTSFEFANPAAIVGPRTTVDRHEGGLDSLNLLSRVAGVIGSDGALAGYAAFADWRASDVPLPKDRDFALGLGPGVVTSDQIEPDELAASVRVDGLERARGTFHGFGWAAACDLAAERTRLYPGDLIVGPSLVPVVGIPPGSAVEIEIAGIGVLEQVVGG